MLLIALAALTVVCGIAAMPQTGIVLTWLGCNVIVTLVIAVCLSGLSVARRRERAAEAAASSWLTALPAASSVSLRVIAGSCAQLLLISRRLLVSSGASMRPPPGGWRSPCQVG